MWVCGRKLTVAVFAVAITVGCGASRPANDAAPEGSATPARWPCREGWVPYGFGGCGPTVLLCEDGGGAADGAGGDVTSIRTDAADGASPAAWTRRADGSIARGWPEPGDPDGPPAADWRPDAGIPSCLAGWVRRADGTCDPVLRSDCAAGSEPVPGGSCTPTAASACTGPDFVDVSAEAGTSMLVHVRAGADGATADGTAAHPMPTLATALAIAGADAWVLLAPGSYDAASTVDRPLHIVGRCAAEVTLRGAADATLVLARGMSAALDVRGVTVAGGRTGIEASGGAALTMRGVIVSGQVGDGIRVGGLATRARIEGCVIRDARSPTTGVDGTGLFVGGGARVEVVAAAMAGAESENVRAVGATVSMERSVVRGPAPRDRGIGQGIVGLSGATLTIDGTVLSRNRAGGIDVVGATAHVRDSIILDTEFARDGRGGGVGLRGSRGARIDAERLHLQRNIVAGIALYDSPTHLDLANSVIVDTAAEPAIMQQGNALSLRTGASATVTGAAFRANHEAALLVLGPRSSADMADSTLEETAPRGDGVAGAAIVVQSGGRLSARRLVLRESSDYALEVAETNSTVDLADSVIRETHSRRGSRDGFGVGVNTGGTARLVRVRVLHSENAGVVAFGADATLEITQSVVTSTRTPPGGPSGGGLAAGQGGARSRGSYAHRRFGGRRSSCERRGIHRRNHGFRRTRHPTAQRHRVRTRRCSYRPRDDRGQRGPRRTRERTGRGGVLRCLAAAPRRSGA